MADAPDLTSVTTKDLVAELRDRNGEVSIAELATDADLRDEAERRGMLFDEERDGPLLENASFEEIEKRLGDEIDFLLDDALADRIGDAIVENRRDDALDMLKTLVPGMLSPATRRGLHACGEALALREMLR